MYDLEKTGELVNAKFGDTQKEMESKSVIRYNYLVSSFSMDI